MRIFYLVLICICISLSAICQDNFQLVKDSILAEAEKLYKSETASWFGTDIFMKEYMEDQNRIKGYFSYSENSDQICVFYDEADDPIVLGTILFKSNEKIVYDSACRKFNNLEKDYYLLRKKANQEIQSDTALFKHYRNTNLNLVPLIEENQKKVYVITGSSMNNVVFLGNDYLMTFDDNYKLLTKKKLHNSLIPLEYGTQKDSQEVGGVHTHLPGFSDFITATDICTLRLYQYMTKWKQHIVVSERYTTMYNCENNSLIIIPRN